MKVTLIMVMSLDGKITEGSNPDISSWTSPEDQAMFKTQIATHDCIVMGSRTYEAARSVIRPSPSKPRIVLTKTPVRFAKEYQPGLTFSADEPQKIVEDAKKVGCKSLLLVGGAETNARFFNAGLVDELLVTIEPLLFGDGTPFVDALRQTAALQLISYKQLNDQGTLLAHYLIKNN